MISLLVGVCFSDFFVVHAMRCMHDPDRVKVGVNEILYTSSQLAIMSLAYHRSSPRL